MFSLSSFFPADYPYIDGSFYNILFNFTISTHGVYLATITAENLHNTLYEAPTDTILIHALYPVLPIWVMAPTSPAFHVYPMCEYRLYFFFLFLRDFIFKKNFIWKTSIFKTRLSSPTHKCCLASIDILAKLTFIKEIYWRNAVVFIFLNFWTKYL